MPAPHASLTLTIASVGARSVASGIAKADEAEIKTSAPTIHLIMLFSLTDTKTGRYQTVHGGTRAF